MLHCHLRKTNRKLSRRFEKLINRLYTCTYIVEEYKIYLNEL